MVFLDDKEKAEVLNNYFTWIFFFFLIKKKELQVLEVEQNWLTGI